MAAVRDQPEKAARWQWVAAFAVAWAGVLALSGAGGTGAGETGVAGLAGTAARAAAAVKTGPDVQLQAEVVEWDPAGRFRCQGAPGKPATLYYQDLWAQADQIAYDRQAQQVELQGHVILRQDTAGEAGRSGAPASAPEKPAQGEEAKAPASRQAVELQAGRIVFDLAADKAQASGGVAFWLEGAGEASMKGLAAQAVFDRKTQQLTLSGGAAGGSGTQAGKGGSWPQMQIAGSPLPAGDLRALIQRSGSFLAASQITVYLQDQRVQAKGNVQIWAVQQ